MGKKIEVTQQQREQIIKLYQQNGYGLEKIKRELGVSWSQSVIKRILQQQKIQLRTFKQAKVGRYKQETPRELELKIIEAYSKGWGLDRIVKELNLPFSFDKVRSILKSNNIHIRNNKEAHEVMVVSDLRKYPVNDNYNLLSHNGAWLMGFIAADGYLPITKGARNRIVITLAEKDREILEKIAREIEYHGPIHNYTSKIGDKEYPSCSLAFASKMIRATLEEYGIVNNKTFKIQHLPNLSQDLLLDFIAGFFDGDGTIYYSMYDNGLNISFVCASKTFLQEIQDYFKSHNLIKFNGCVSKDKNVFQLSFGKEDSLSLSEAFYNNNFMRLQRKKDIYLSFRE